MIYYFSGLGNTAYVAKKLSEALGEKLKFIPEVTPVKEEFEGDYLGILFPVYSWGIPVNVVEFIRQLPESVFDAIRMRKKPVWMVCTYGDETGQTVEMLNKILKKRGISLQGAWGVRMPNTYVLLPGFNIDSPEVEEKKLKDAPHRIEEIIGKIKSNSWEWDIFKGSFPSLRSMVYPLFKKWGISVKKWHFTNACVKCGKCVKSCPVRNITMGTDGPIWGENCVSCCACFHHCPYHAVEYGNITKDKGQYVCPL